MKNTGLPILKLVLFGVVVVLLSQRGPALADENERDFSYAERSSNGPGNWGNIHRDWAMCRDGKVQSPINIRRENVQIPSTLGGLNLNYLASNATIENKVHTIKLEWANKTGSISIDGAVYDLRQCHWHWPAEHIINGQRFQLELHLVHEGSDGKKAVIGVLYKLGDPDPFLTKLTESIENARASKLEKMEVGIVNPQDINLKSEENYYRYIGSLTTPPCTEGVIWTIIQQERTVSADQVELLKELLIMISSPMPGQPNLSNGRQINAHS